MERGIELARAVAAAHSLPQGPVQIVDQRGSVNHVFIVGEGPERYVIRFARDPQRADEFAVERWCAQRAAAHGVPTPDVLASGVMNDVAYGVQRFAPGMAGDTLTDPELWGTLGSYGHVINSIPPDDSAPDGLFSRFGRDLPAAWKAHLDYNVGELDVNDPLLAMGVYLASQQDRLKQTLIELSDIPMRFGLSHGDLSTRNLVVPAGQRPMLIDWGSATYGPVPLTDLLVLERAARTTGSPTGTELRAFAMGMHVNLEQLRPTLSEYRQLHLLDLVRWAMAWRPDRVAEAVVDLRSALIES